MSNNRWFRRLDTIVWKYHSIKVIGLGFRHYSKSNNWHNLAGVVASGARFIFHRTLCVSEARISKLPTVRRVTGAYLFFPSLYSYPWVPDLSYLNAKTLQIARRVSLEENQKLVGAGSPRETQNLCSSHYFRVGCLQYRPQKRANIVSFKLGFLTNLAESANG